MQLPEIRPLRTLHELRDAVELQKIYWGDNAESIIPAHMLFSLANHGGHVLAAFVESQMVGVLIGFLGTSEQDTDRPAMANLQIVSKRMVVLPAFRNHGIGYRLKLAQRRLAIAQGVRLVTWTFDPLMAANAHLNVRKLGVTVEVYHENYYGTEDDGAGLVALNSSDRMLAEWWVTHRRVEERLHGKRRDLTLRQYLEADTTIVNPTDFTADGLIQPGQQIHPPTSALALVEIPLDFPTLVRETPALAQSWRLHTREVFSRLLVSGYMVTDFLRESYEGRDRAFYLLSYNGPQAASSYIMN